MFEEKRRSPRVASSIVVHYREHESDAGATSFLRGQLENVSQGGIFLTTDEPLPQGTVVDLEFQLNSRSRAPRVKARALVKWNRKIFEPFGMGLEFLDFSEADRSRFDSWLDQLATPVSGRRR